MQKSYSTQAGKHELATSDDVARILGNLDPTKMLPIMALRPTIVDVEEASMWLGPEHVAIAAKPHGSFFNIHDCGPQCHDWHHLGWVKIAKNSRHIVSGRESTLRRFCGVSLLHPLLSM